MASTETAERHLSDTRQQTGEGAGETPADGRWEHFPHGADVGVRGFGASLERAFEETALALTAVLTEPEKVEPKKAVRISCAASDDELLLVEWLNAIVFEMATRGMVFGRYEVRIEGGRLRGRAWGEPVDIARHEPAVEIKGATMTELRVEGDEAGRWLAQCVVDV